MEVRLKAQAGSGYSLSAVGYLVMALGARAEESSDNYTGLAASVGASESAIWGVGSEIWPAC